jgi:hypothetical protein
MATWLPGAMQSLDVGFGITIAISATMADAMPGPLVGFT